LISNGIVARDLAHIHAGLGAKSAAFRDQTIVITGCAGFLGFYITRYFVEYAETLGVNASSRSTRSCSTSPRG
jgi:UDP-glucuronate decarboxylase